MPMCTDSRRVVIAHPDPLLRRGLRCVLEEHGITVVAEVCTERDALETTIRLRPDVLVLGPPNRLDEMLRVLPIVTRLSRVLMLTNAGDTISSKRAIQHGAVGSLVHGEFTVPDLIRAVTGTSRVPRTEWQPTAKELRTTIVGQLSR